MLSSIFFFFFFNDTATTEIYTLSLHDALPILCPRESATAHHFRNSGVRWRLHRRPWPGCLGGLRTRLRIRRRPGAPSGLFALGIAQEGRKAGGRPLSHEHVLLGRFSPTGTDAHRPVANASDRFRVENSPLGVTAPNEASNPTRPEPSSSRNPYRQGVSLGVTGTISSPPFNSPTPPRRGSDHVQCQPGIRESCHPYARRTPRLETVPRLGHPHCSVRGRRHVERRCDVRERRKRPLRRVHRDDVGESPGIRSACREPD